MLSFWEWTTKETLKKSSRKKLATATRKRPNCKWVHPLGALPSFSSPRQLHRSAKMPTWALVDFLPGLRISVLPLAAWRHCRQWCLVWWCVHTGILTAFHSTSLPSQGDLKQTDIISDQCEHNVPWREGGGGDGKAKEWVLSCLHELEWKVQRLRNDHEIFEGGDQLPKTSHMAKTQKKRTCKTSQEKKSSLNKPQAWSRKPVAAQESCPSQP